jgi:HD-GYP domain-containing protein (c-di-GMP phosphodiesterase class II)
MLQSVSRGMGARAPELVTDSAAPELRWRRRPALRASLRVAAVVAPAVSAAAVAVAFSRTVPVPRDLSGTVVWWIVFVAAVVATWTLSAELLQRTLPLATLLDLTLVFPESVPSRFAILRRNLDRRHLETDLRRLRERSDPESGSRAQLILELAVAMSLHDGRTRAHSERVRTYTDLVAQQLHLPQHDADRLRWAALLHDIGKLAVAPEILNKPELPDEDELESLRNHPVEGYRLIAPLHRWLGPWAATVRDHHERFDGTGYPSGLRGRAISLGGRIVAVTDSYETMTNGRPYRKALSVRAAREELVRRSGGHFDPDVVRAFLAISLGRLWPVVGIGALLAEVPLLPSVSWRFSQMGSRTVSGLATASTTAVLIIAGVAGPLVGPLVYGPSLRPHVAQAGTATQQGAPAQAAQPAPAVTPPAVTPPVVASPPSFPASGLRAPGSTPAAGPGTQPGAGGGKSVFPAGIGKRATLPAGIAKKPNPFAHWRLHH